MEEILKKEILKTFPINLDMKRVTAQSTPIPPLVVDDTGNVFEITLTDGGVPVDLRECWVFAQFSLPDGTTSSRSTEDAEDPIIIDGDDHNIIKLRLNNVNYTAGKNNCEVEVYSGEGHSTLVTSANFNFDARAKIVNSETAQRDPSFPFLLGLIERVDGALDKLDDAVSAEENRVVAEQERVEAEIEREQKVDEVYQAYESGALKGDKGDTGAAGKDGKDGKVQSVDNVQPNSNGTLTLSAVRYASQTLTTNQQEQARKNINAAPSSSYINAQDDGYSLTLSDAGKLVLINSETDCTVSIPAAIDFPIGTEIEVAQMGAGVVNIFAFGADIFSMDGMTSTAGQYAVVCLKKLDETTWLLGGALA